MAPLMDPLRVKVWKVSLSQNRLNAIKKMKFYANLKKNVLGVRAP